jgi:hypothetical protein
MLAKFSQQDFIQVLMLVIEAEFEFFQMQQKGMLDWENGQCTKIG